MKRRLISTGTFLVIVILGFGVLANWQWIRDKYVVSTSQLQPASAAILPDLNLSSEGDFIYRASRPEIQSADVFSVSCKNVAHEHSIVLGCYTQQRLYVYDVKDSRLDGVKQVTSAHELLHAVYERLSTKEKATLDKELLSVADSISDQRFKDTIAEYRKTEPDQIANEIHSILGTEIEVLPNGLEQHYQKYFKNRQAIVSFAKQYEGTFSELDTTIKQYDSNLETLRKRKETLESELASQQSQIESDRARLDSLRSSNPSTYNQLVPEYNEKIRSYNQNISAIKEIVADYNALVEKRNTLATTQNDLVKQLDSSYQNIE